MVQPAWISANRSDGITQHGLRSLARYVLCYVLLFLSLVATAPASALSTAQEITQEAAAPNSEVNHPLPLMGSWDPGETSDNANATDVGYTADWQLQMISAGHHILPWFAMPDPGVNSGSNTTGNWLTNLACYQNSIQAAATLGLPISFVGTQWEHLLYDNAQYITMPPDQNANVLIAGVTVGTTLGSPQVVARGSGYTVGDVLTAVGGTYTTPAQVTVGTTDGTGGSGYVYISNGGAYTVFPANPVSFTGGTGQGLTANMYDGIVKQQVSPLGAIGPWKSVGNTWGSSPLMQQLQAWYPNPPLVLLISNNETQVLNWSDANQDQHYTSLYGTGQTAEFKREIVAQGWIDRYRALQSSFRGAFTSTAWQNNSRFIGYAAESQRAFGPRFLGRWYDWQDYALYNTNRIDPGPLMWDGGSPPYYLENNEPGRDDLVFSPQVEAMNYDFMLKEASQLNPGFWFEISFWNGCDSYPPDPSNSKCADLISNIPNYSPARYGGMVQFGMWLTRPRVVRDFRFYATPRSQSQPYFDALMSAVDRVYTNPVLKSFWRSGQLVANTTRPHPYQANIPTEYATANRMFMLTTSLDPPQPWTLSTPIPVFALARVNGAAPQRQWLVYAFAPNGTISGVQVTIPSYQTISLDATVAGAFYLVDEATATVTTLGNGDPGGGGCSYAINPGSASDGASGGTGSVSVTTGAACAWTAISNASWITVGSSASTMSASAMSSNGSGNSTVAYSVSPNSGAARSGTMTIAGLTFTVNQAAASCAYSLSTTGVSAPVGGATGSFNVTGGSGCAWTATSNASWIKVVSGVSGNGNGTVSYSVSANSGAARSGTLTVAGQTFTVSQAGSCAYSLSATSSSAPAGGATGSFNVTAGSGCAWTATSNASWITLVNGASGNGNGAVSYSVSANAGAARSGTLTVAGQTFTVSQAGSCAYSLSATSASAPAGGATGSFNVTAGSACAWTASSNATWITLVSGASGNRNGTVSYSVSANTGAARSGTLTVAGQTFTVSQAGATATCTISLKPTSTSILASATRGTINVSAPSGCAWTATSNVSWITVSAGVSGSGNGSVSYLVAANSGPARSGTLTIGGQTFTISQHKGK